MTTLYVFLDESGNFDFGPRGTCHFVLSAMYTTTPGLTAAAMQELKYARLAAREQELEFHATENRQATRDAVVTTINGIRDHFKVHTIWADKHFAHSTKQDPVEMMALVGTAMGRWICKAAGTGHDQVVLVFDSVLTGRKQDAFKAAVKPALKQLGIPFHLCFHPVKSDLNGQIADYFSWAMFRRLENRDNRSYLQLWFDGWTEFHIFHNGHTRYWNPEGR